MTDEELEFLKNKISYVLELKKAMTTFDSVCKKLSNLEKENTELKQQIERMKNCDNCQHYYDESRHVCDCKDYSGWRLKNGR